MRHRLYAIVSIATVLACGAKGSSAPASGSAPPSVTPAGSVAAPRDCAHDHGGCHANAVCNETPLGARCECKPGFAGNGTTCTEVAVGLQGSRWDMPCKAPSGGKDVCPPKDGKPSATVRLGGSPDGTYLVTLRFRGVVEQQRYAGGEQDGFFYVGGRSDDGSYNVYELRTSEPTQSYFLNAGKAGIRHCFPIDYTRTIAVKGGASLTLLADAQDGRLITAFGEDGKPVVVPDVAPADNDGQFVQMDVIDVSEGADSRLVIDASVLFAVDEADLGPDAKGALSPALEAARKAAGAQLVVEGHTDATGDAAHNQELSVRRARAVAEWLASQGVGLERLVVRGRGASQPVAPNDSDAGRAKNRRVEIAIHRP